MIKILIVDDEKPICDLIDLNLSSAGYHCTSVQDGLEAIDLIEKEEFELVLLDIMLPGADGFDIMEYIRPLKIPVIFITAKHDVHDKVRGLKLGAEDYLVKPFAFEELLARIRCVARRPHTLTGSDTLSVADIDFQLGEGILTGPSGSCTLSKKEAALLEAFLRSGGQTLHRSTLLLKVWGPDSDVEDGNLDNYIHFLRRRLQISGSRLRITTVRGIGYRLQED